MKMKKPRYQIMPDGTLQTFPNWDERFEMVNAVASGWKYDVLTDWEANAYNIIGQADAILKQMNEK